MRECKRWWWWWWWWWWCTSPRINFSSIHGIENETWSKSSAKIRPELYTYDDNTPMMIHKRNTVYTYTEYLSSFFFFFPPFFSFFFFSSVKNNEQRKYVRAYSTKIETVAESVTKHSLQRIVMNETYSVFLFFLFNLSLSLFSFLFFNLIYHTRCNISGGIVAWNIQNTTFACKTWVLFVSSQLNRIIFKREEPRYLFEILAEKNNGLRNSSWRRPDGTRTSAIRFTTDRTKSVVTCFNE